MKALCSPSERSGEMISWQTGPLDLGIRGFCVFSTFFASLRVCSPFFQCVGVLKTCPPYRPSESGVAEGRNPTGLWSAGTHRPLLHEPEPLAKAGTPLRPTVQPPSLSSFSYPGLGWDRFVRPGKCVNMKVRILFVRRMIDRKIKTLKTQLGISENVKPVHSEAKSTIAQLAGPKQECIMDSLPDSSTKTAVEDHGRRWIASPQSLP